MSQENVEIRPDFGRRLNVVNGWLARRGLILDPRWLLWRLRTAGGRWLARRGVIVHKRGAPDHFTLGPSTGRYYPVDFKAEWIDTIERVGLLTSTSPERLAALCSATEYVVRHELPGSFVECGVGRGGSVMAMALTLQRLGVGDRDLYLFDTFSGITRPTEADVDFAGVAYLDHWPSLPNFFGVGASLPEVEAALATTGYDPAHLHFVQGDVEETLPDNAPSQIALLRLDTDWYESTRHELIHLYPRLALGGVVIIDDYGHLEGQTKATDEYFSGHRILLGRIDYSGRIAVKQEEALEAAGLEE
jgi:O-methyltransferase